MRTSTRPNIRPAIKVDKNAVYRPMIGCARPPVRYFPTLPTTKSGRARATSDLVGVINVTTLWARGYRDASAGNVGVLEFLDHVNLLLAPAQPFALDGSYLALRRAVIFARHALTKPATVDVAQTMLALWAEAVGPDSPLAEVITHRVEK